VCRKGRSGGGKAHSFIPFYPENTATFELVCLLFPSLFNLLSREHVLYLIAWAGRINATALESSAGLRIGVTVQGLWTVDKLQGALVDYDYERNVCIESIYKTLRGEEGGARE